MDLNDVKAGKYQLVAARWDQITSKPGEPLDYVRHRRGDIVDLSSEDAKRLVSAGAVVRPGQLEKTKAEEARALAERAAAEYQAILAGLPDDVRAEVTTQVDPKPAFSAGSTAEPTTIKDIIAAVGDDVEKATAALTSEYETKGDKARPKLVEALEAVINATATGDGGSDEDEAGS